MPASSAPPAALANPIARNFDRAAATYDDAAPVQVRVAARLVQLAADTAKASPAAILDIGCGTGLIAQRARQQWPHAAITAMDQAPLMLQQAQQRLPGLQTIAADIADLRLAPAFDLIVSGMALHWLARPRLALEQWRRGLRAGGQLVVALLIEGSFQEWRSLCAQHDAADGLWPMPARNFANGVAESLAQETITVPYANAHDFLKQLKAIGAHTPRANYHPLTPAAMRHLLQASPAPFAVSYEVLYLRMTP